MKWHFDRSQGRRDRARSPDLDVLQNVEFEEKYLVGEVELRGRRIEKTIERWGRRKRERGRIGRRGKVRETERERQRERKTYREREEKE